MGTDLIMRFTALSLLSVCIPAAFGDHAGIHRRNWRQISGCSTSSNQLGYECELAFDGVIDGRPGWANAKKLPASVTFDLESPSKVNRIALVYNRIGYQATKFRIELNVGGRKWMVPYGLDIEGGRFGTIKNGVIHLYKGIQEVDIKFNTVKQVTGVRLTVLATNSADKNSVLNEIFAQYVPDMSGCKTVGGMNRGRDCIFPFVNPFNGAVHHGCTMDYGLPPWCATRTNNNGHFTKKEFTGFCHKDCELEEHSTCYGLATEYKYTYYSSDRAYDRRQCIFPFKKDGKWNNKCIENREGIPMCATTVTEEGEAKDMAFCGSECPGSHVASQCVEAKDGTGKGHRCVFPFKMGKKTYTTCTEENKCATSVKSNYYKMDQLNNKEFGYCGAAGSCNEDECITVGGPSVGEVCRFPFKNPKTNELHWNCTTAMIYSTATSGSMVSAPWCATETTEDDKMVSGKWGFCSKKCSQEVQNNCYVDDGKTMASMKRCIFPFVWKNVQYNKCVPIDGVPSCPTYTNTAGVVTSKSYMKPCGPSEACSDYNIINGKVITAGWRSVGSYLNNGTEILYIDFNFETGVQDSQSFSWSVSAEVSAGFAAYGAQVGMSISAGIGGGSEKTTSNAMSHTLRYDCPPRTKIELMQKILTSGPFEYRTFDLILTHLDLDKLAKTRELTTKDLEDRIESTPIEEQ